MAKPRRPRETEVKLAFRPADRARLAALLDGMPPTRRLVTTYYDTVNDRLARQGAALRVRSEGAQHTQAVKLDRHAGSGAAAERGEWEWPLSDERPALDRLGGTPLADLAETDAEIRPVFRTEVERATRLLRPGGKTEIEAALDEGAIVAGNQIEPLHELELELKQGRRDRLYRVAAALHARVPMVIATESKGRRGASLHSRSPSGAAKPTPLTLKRSARVPAAFRRTMGSALGALLANMAPTLRGDVEGLHQMRVAARRLRAMLVLFGPVLRPEPADGANEALRRVGRILGEARDWDVFVDETLPAAAEDGDWVEPLRGAGDDQRTQAHDRVRAALTAPEFTGLMLELSAGIETAGKSFVAPDRRGRPIAEAAPALLDRLALKVAKRGKHAAKLEGAKLHDLRKSLKKLRYGIAALASLYPGRVVDRYLDQCKALQKLLGRINDAAATRQLAARIRIVGGADLAGAAEELARWARRRERKGHKKLGKAWHGFAAADPFWH